MEAPELEWAPQKCPCTPECRRPTSLAGTPTPHPPERIVVDLADGHGGCHTVHVTHKAVPQLDNKGSVVMGDMTTHCYPHTHVVPEAACARGALVVAASGERGMHARGCNPDAPGEEPLPWSARVEMLPSQPAPRTTCCTPGECRACWRGLSSGIQREQRCDWWLSVVWRSWRAVCRWGHGSKQLAGRWRPGCSP